MKELSYHSYRNFTKLKGIYHSRMSSMLLRARRIRANRFSFILSTKTILKRSYSVPNEDILNSHPPVWGYQKPTKFGLPDYTPQQLYNRASQAPLMRLIESYRRHAHRSASLDPLSLAPRPPVPALDPRRYGFKLSSDFLSSKLPLNHQSSLLPDQSVPIISERDESEIYNVDGLLGMGPLAQSNDHRFSLDQIIQRLQQVYCGRIAYEFMHLPVKQI
ncbi:expressed protein [Phakopsora pachyrhizi]|uniref:Expressed protein n=1 Tax=Phakopsora pachyrhizi TaxID=170000 RepID=A0AAV0B593_PHAPC|nr:expressed protein [Phakopsora pachyrhizi]